MNTEALSITKFVPEWLYSEKLTLKQQFEFLDNYLSLKTGLNSQASNQLENIEKKEVLDIEVLMSMRDIFSQELSIRHVYIKVCADVLELLSSGHSIDVALSRWFNRDIVMVFEGCGQSKDISTPLNQLLSSMREQHELFKKNIASLGVPAFFFIACIAFITYFAMVQFPSMIGQSADDASVLVQSFTVFSSFLVQKGPQVLALIGVLFCWIAYSLSHTTGALRTHLDKVPPWSIYQALVANRFFSLLAVLIRGGMSLRGSLNTLNHYSSPYMRSHIDLMLELTQNGDVDLVQLDTGLLPLMLRVKMRIAGKKGGDEAVFDVLSNNAGKDFSRYMDKITSTTAKVLIGLTFTLMIWLLFVVFEIVINKYM